MPYIVISVIFAVIAFVLLGMVKIGNGVIWRLNKKQIIAPFFLLIILIGCFKTVPTGHTGIITTFGKVEDRTLDAGVHFLAPWKTVVNMDNRTQKQTLTMNCFSSDIQEVSVVYTINYSIEKSNAQNIYKNIGIDYFNTVVLPKASEALKSVFAKYTAENLVSARGDLSTSIEEILVRNVSGYHINVEATSIEDIDFTDAFTTAVEEKQVAQQNKLKAETEAEKLVIEAQAAADAALIAANNEAEIIKVKADAAAYEGTKEAEIMNALGAELAENPKLIEYYFTQNWDGKLPTTMLNDNISALFSLEQQN